MKPLLYALPVLLGLCGEAAAVNGWIDCKDLATRYRTKQDTSIWIIRKGTTWGDYTGSGVEMPGLIFDLETVDHRGTLHSPGVSNLFAGPPIENCELRYEWDTGPESQLMPPSMYWRKDEGIGIVAEFTFEKCEEPPSKSRKPAGTRKPAQ